MYSFLLIGLCCSILADIGLIHPVHKPLEVVVGSEVTIDIMENPSTGYAWKLFDESYATGGFLSYISDFRVEMNSGESDGEKSAMGAPLIHRFVFRGEKSGSTKVLFVQVRFGEIETSAVPESYFVHVVEKPDTGMIHPVHKPLQVVVGSEVVIDMTENPTTGYSWKLVDESYATSGFLSYVSDFRVEMDGGEESDFGAPSIHRFVFRGEKCGSTKVLFVQVRFGVEVVADPETYFVHVVEKPDTGMIGPILADIGLIHPVHKPFEVVVGSEVMIDIMENPSTGYTWKFFDDSYTVGGFLSYVSDSMILMEDGEKSVGAPLVHRFIFRGEKCGVAKVRFVKVRFGEIEASAVPESYFVHVVEKPDTGMIHPVHKPLQVVVGSEVVIDMTENPTTGYSWKLVESYATSGFLSYVSDFRVEMDGGEESDFGAPSIHRFVFRGEKCGSTKVLFVQVRFGVEVVADPETYFVHVVEMPNTGVINSN